MATVNVYGRLDGKCQLCEAAKAKLNLMGIRFKCFELADTVAWHEGWRDDESVEVTAVYSDIDTYPVITVDGKAMSYPEAMKRLRALKPSKPEVQQPVEVFEFSRVEEEEAVCV